MGKVKFNNDKYITAGIQNSIDEKIQMLLWELIGRLGEDRDYLQVFDISVVSGKNKNQLKIVHKQEEPQYIKTYYILDEQFINAKIFVIDDETHSTMLLAEEYWYIYTN